MKGYYLFAPVEPACVGPESGVERKVRAQHRALSQHLDCELVIWEPVKYTQTIAERIRRRLPCTAAWRRWAYHGEFDDADFLYIRQVYHDRAFARYLRAIKKANPRVKIIYEVPTWPYLTETKPSLSQLPFDLKERLNAPRAAKLCDRIVTFYGQDRIWGVRCIKLLNGYDFAQVQLPHRELGKTIHILSVAANAFWHGYERVILGLHEYYTAGGTVPIVYHMVGAIDPAHQELVRRHNLEDHVIFHGPQSGDALAQIYQQSHIGIDVLAGHKIDYPRSSSLKSREYGAWGIPLVTASPVDYMEPDDPYQLIVPYDDSPLDIPAVIGFCRRIYGSAPISQIARAIRTSAQQHCDMPVTMQPVADYLLNISQEKE